MKKKNKRIWGVIVLVFILLLAGWIYNKNKKVIPQYNYINLTSQNLVQEVSGVGTVRASQELELNFSSAGKINVINVKSGQRVSSGQVLMELDYQAASLLVREAESGLKIAQANLNKLINGPTKTELDIYRSQLEAARLNYEASLVDLANTKISNQATISTAEINLANIQISSQQAVDSAYDSLINTLAAKLTVANSALDYINRLLEDEDLKAVYSVKNTSYGALSKTQYQEALLSRSLAENSQNLSLANDISKVVELNQDYLDRVLVTLNSVFRALENTIIYADLSQTQLDTYKNTVNSHLTSITASGSQLLSADHSYRSALSSQQSSLSSYTQALNSARINTVTLESQATSRVNATREALNLSQNQLNKISQAPRAEDLSLAQAQLSQAQASYEIASRQLQDSKIVSPIEGVISKVNYEVGEQVSAAKTAIAMITDNNFEIELDVSEADISKIKINDQVEISLDAFSDDRKFSGVVYFIEPGSTVISGVIYYRLKIKFLDEAEKLTAVKAGMTANTVIKTASREKVLAVPLRAVLDRNGEGKIVRRLLDEKKGIIEEIQVTTGLSAKDGLIEILPGSLELGDRIITSVKEGKK